MMPALVITLAVVLVYNFYYGLGNQILTIQKMAIANLNPNIAASEAGRTNIFAQLENVRNIGLVDNVSLVNVDEMSQQQLLFTIHSYLDNINIICKRKLLMGNLRDGGWEICDDPDVRPKQPCLIYSFGRNNDSSFNYDSSKIYGCNVYSFDPSMARPAQKKSDLVMFYKIGLSGKTFTNDKKWDMKTLADIRAMLGHQTQAISVIKIDIENSEWDAIPDMLASGTLNNVRQLLIEYHIKSSAESYLRSRLKAIQLIEKAGFKRFYVHKNDACRIIVTGYPVIRSACYEVHYIRRP